MFKQKNKKQKGFTPVALVAVVLLAVALATVSVYLFQSKEENKSISGLKPVKQVVQVEEGKAVKEVEDETILGDEIDVSDWQVYRNKEHQINFYYPNTWYLKENINSKEYDLHIGFSTDLKETYTGDEYPIQFIIASTDKKIFTNYTYSNYVSQKNGKDYLFVINNNDYFSKEVNNKKNIDIINKIEESLWFDDDVSFMKDWQTYSNNEYSFEFNYPKTWLFNEKKITSFMPDFKDISSLGYGIFNNEKKLTVDDWINDTDFFQLKQYENASNDMLIGHGVGDSVLIKDNGIFKYHYIGGVEGGGRFEVLIVPNNDKVIVLSYGVGWSYEQQRVSIKQFKEIINSFKFIKKETLTDTQIIQKYYTHITNNELQEAYDMYQTKKVSFEEFKGWYKNTILAEPEGITQLEDGNYQFEVKLQDQGEGVTRYNVVMKVSDGKIDTLSSEEELIEDISDWKTYRNEKLGFEIKFPNDLYYIDNYASTNYRLVYFTLSASSAGTPLDVTSSMKIIFKPYYDDQINNKDTKQEVVINSNSFNYYPPQSIYDYIFYIPVDLDIAITFLPELKNKSRQILSTLKFIEKEEIVLGTLEIELVDTSDWQTYKNKEYGFEFKYPKDYHVLENNENGVLVLSSGEVKKVESQAGTEGFSVDVNIVGHMSLSEILKKESRNNYEKIVIDGQDSIMLRLNSICDETIYIPTLNRDSMVNISNCSSEDDVFTGIYSTFKFIDKK